MTDFSRTKEITFSDFHCTPFWVWKGQWKVEVTSSTDPDGWMYGEDADHCQATEPSPQMRVRRRLWVRECYRLFD